MNSHEYDLIVIGSGPAGQKGAICAAKLRRKVAIIDRKRTIGGVCVHTGTIPSKTLREAVLYLSGFRQRTFYGQSYVLKDRVDMQDLIFRANSVMTREIDVIKAQLRRNNVTTMEGNARFVDANTIEIVSEEATFEMRADKILVACGTRPAHDAGIPIDGKRIFDSDQICDLQEIPRELVVVGAGIIGLEYASIFAAIGVKVTHYRSKADAAGFRGSRNCREPVLPTAAIGDGVPIGREGRFGCVRSGARSRLRQVGERQGRAWTRAALCSRPAGE